MFRALAAEQGISLSVANAECPPVRFDHQRILQVLANLVGNAIKFTPTNGRISIRLEPAGSEVRVSVADTGIGISAEKLGSVFERFVQERRTKGGGLGLGLFIARSIVEAHGGRIWAESAPGHGSTFFFTLPATRSRKPNADGVVSVTRADRPRRAGRSPRARARARKS